jgi:hypothetical protein
MRSAGDPLRKVAMPIPELNEAGLLPAGIHQASLEEVRALFGRFQRTDRRPALFAKLSELLGEARSTGLVVAVVIDGSFVTAKDEPSDIDLILVLDPRHDYDADLKPFSPFAYWVSESIRRIFGRFPILEDLGIQSRVGGQTSDDFRYLRLHWETSMQSPGAETNYCPFVKGGSRSP